MTQAVSLVDLASLAFVDVSALGPGRTLILTNGSPTLEIVVEVTNNSGSSNAVQVGETGGTTAVLVLPLDEASQFMRVRVTAGAIGAAQVWVQGPNVGSVQIDLTTSTQDVSSIGEGRTVYVRGGSNVSIAIEAAESLISTQFREIGRLSASASPGVVRFLTLPSDTSNFVRYRVAQGSSPTAFSVWIAGGPTGAGGGGAAGPAGGDLAGTYPDPTVVQLTGAAGIVTMPPATTIQQTQAVADATMIPLQIVTQTGHSLFFILQGAGVDDTFSWGWDAKGQGGEPHYGNYTQERLFAGAQEAYQEFDGVYRPWFASYVDTTTALTVVLESSQDGGVVIQDFTSNVTVGMASFTKASSTVDGQTVNLGSDAHTTQTTLHASTIHYRQINSATIDQLSVSGTNAQVTIGAGLTTYGFEGVAGQALFMQANGVGALVNLDSTRVLISSSGSKIDVDSTGIGFFAHATAAKQTVTGVKVDAVAASILAALVAMGLVTDATT